MKIRGSPNQHAGAALPNTLPNPILCLHPLKGKRGASASSHHSQRPYLSGLVELPRDKA